jgi:hypothetical protein
MDTPKVQLPGPGTPVAQTGANSNSNEVEMTESHDAESTNQIEETQAEDNTMPDVQAGTEPEAPAPVQKTAGFNFLK